ncbi:hypothetical protein NL676_016163 [Syzygium grande]|nr:hypothetical protein NL676_016163 [Syzygium grande]
MVKVLWRAARLDLIAHFLRHPAPQQLRCHQRCPCLLDSLEPPQQPWRLSGRGEPPPVSSRGGWALTRLTAMPPNSTRAVRSKLRWPLPVPCPKLA